MVIIFKFMKIVLIIKQIMIKFSVFIFFTRFLLQNVVVIIKKIIFTTFP